jgi:small-conductance mechanosensitive channel
MEKQVTQLLFDPTLGKIVASILGILIILALANFIRRYLERYLHEDINKRFRVRQVLRIISYIIIIFYLTIVFNQRLGNLTVAFGVAGAGIAFALQDVITSAAGWFVISFAGFYDIGDRIKMGDLKGDVIDVSLLRTTLMEIGDWIPSDLYTGRIVRVANSFIFKSPVYNYSADFPFLWDEITVPVKFGCDYQLVRSVLQAVADEVVGEYTYSAQINWETIARKYLVEKAKIEPMITLQANSNWVEFTLRYIVDYKARRITKDRLFMRLLEELNRYPERISIASTTFQLVDLPTINVNAVQN